MSRTFLVIGLVSLSLAVNPLVWAAEPADRWQQEGGEVKRLQAVHQKEIKEVRKDMEYLFDKERKQLTQQIQKKETENQRILSNLQSSQQENERLAAELKSAKGQREILEAQPRKAEARWKEQMMEVQRETAQLKADFEKRQKADQEKIRRAEEKTRPALQEMEKKRIELEHLRSGLIQDWTRLYIRVGTLEAAQAHYPEAEVAFRQAATLTPSSGVAHYNLAVLYDEYGKERSKAIEEYKIYLLLTPHAADAEAVKNWVQLLTAEDGSQRRRQDWTRSGAKGFNKTLKQILQ